MTFDEMMTKRTKLIEDFNVEFRIFQLAAGEYGAVANSNLYELSLQATALLKQADRCNRLQREINEVLDTIDKMFPDWRARPYKP